MRVTRVLALAAILGIALSFRATAKVVYDSETTNTWFTVNMSSLTSDDLKSSPWSPLRDGEATVKDAVIKLDTDLDDPLTYTAVDNSADVAIVAAEMTATVNASEPELTDDIPQAALCVIGTASATNWVGLVGTTEGDAGYKWETFTTPVPVAGETYSVRIEFDQRQSRQIRYRVDDTVLGDGWYPNPKASAKNIKSVSFSGTGDISGLGGSNVVENAATFNGVGYVTFEAALAEAKESGAWADGNPIVLYKNAEYTASATETLYVNPNGKTFTIGGEVAVDVSGNTYGITAGSECEAMIGDKYYSTIEKAITAATAGQTIVVNKTIEKALTFNNTSVTLNTNGKTVTCATLTVASGVTLTLANALAVTDAVIAGSVAGAGLTVNGTLTGTSITSLTLGGNATFAYAGAPLAAATLGTALNVTGLSQAEIGATIINSVTADSTTFTSDLPAGKCLEVAEGALKVASVAKITEVAEEEGYDYTNGTVKVTATVKSGTATAELTVVGWDGTTVKTATKNVTSGTAMTWEVADVLEGALTQGGVYTYKVDIKIGDIVVATKSGEFAAATWGNVWFGADASKGEGLREFNGEWAVAPAVDPTDNVYVIEEDSVFNVAVGKQELGSNRVTRVDAKVTFESLVDGDVDVPEDDAISGFVATTEGWKALAEGAWVSLTGGSAPVAGTPYVVRAEVDFISDPKRVRYLVSEDDGATFVPLFTSSGTLQWIELASSTKSLLAKVELQGSGKLAKFEATVADKALFEVNSKKYDTMEEALDAAGTNGEYAITLLTNATIEPTDAGKYEIAPGNYHYVSGGKDSTGNRTIIVDKSGEPPVVRPTDAEMQKVMTPDGNSYKDYDSLRKFLEKNKVEGYTNDNANAESVSNALEVTGTNSLKIWQDYALGIDVGTPVAPVTTPAGDTNQDNITLAIPAIDTAKYSGDYTISYQVKKGAAAVGNPSDNPSAILIPLESNCTGTYSIKAIFTPKTEPEQTESDNL